jgi:hypothetical protein
MFDSCIEKQGLNMSVSLYFRLSIFGLTLMTFDTSWLSLKWFVNGINNSIESRTTICDESDFLRKMYFNETASISRKYFSRKNSQKN